MTFLAYGNGAPDIFSAVAGFVNSNNTGNLALSALIGKKINIYIFLISRNSLFIFYFILFYEFVHSTENSTRAHGSRVHRPFYDKRIIFYKKLWADCRNTV